MTIRTRQAEQQRRPSRRRLLRLPALQVRQGPNRVLYSFAVDGKQISSFATVSRVHRDDQAELHGYQRPEVLAHIASIRRYLESSDPMIPNALVVAFDQRVRFQPASGTTRNGSVRLGTLVIPIDPDIAEEDRPGWVVDGQQRCAAIREARIESFPICVTAFITDSDADQRAQFILVNSTKPLPKGLIHELLPVTGGVLPVSLQLRRFPSLLLNRLNYDSDSPMRRMIHTPTTPNGTIKDNSVLRMLENSLTDGALYRYREPSTGEGDAEAMLRLVKDFWTAVSLVFADAWGLPPRRSRLMHGVGVVSLGFLMDAIVDRHFRIGLPTTRDFAEDLRALSDICNWTSGVWEFGSHHHRKWNDLQNTPKDIQLLTNYLLFEYKVRVWSSPLGNRRDA